jgi:hypothetical protein
MKICFESYKFDFMKQFASKSKKRIENSTLRYVEGIALIYVQCCYLIWNTNVFKKQFHSVMSTENDLYSYFRKSVFDQKVDSFITTLIGNGMSSQSEPLTCR